MDVKGEEFLRCKFLHLFNSFDHGKKGYIERQDADLQSNKFHDILRRQLQENGVKDSTEIEKRVQEFNSNWMPGAMKYFLEMSQFAKEAGSPDKITKKDFISFKMSIREHITKNDALPLWFEDSLRMSFTKCWATQGQLNEEGLELLPGVNKETISLCHLQLTDNNNKKVGESEFISLIKDYYSINDPEHISKFIHGYQ